MTTRCVIFPRAMRLFLLAFSFFLLSFAARADLWTTGYYPGYRSTLLPPSQIDFTALTHVIHFSAIPNNNGTLNTNANSLSYTNATNLIAVAHAAKKKVLFSVGPSGGSVFTNAASVANLPTFIKNLTNLMTSWGYDGIDIDWEPISASDSARFTAFITSLRNALNTITPRPLLTAAVATLPSLIGSLQTNFDQVNIMTYDMSGTYPGWITWHNAPLYNGGVKFPSTGGYVHSTETMVNNFTNSGVPLNKIGIGIAFYGYIWAGGAGTTTGGASLPAQSYTNDPVTSQVAFSTVMNTYYQSNLYHWDSNALAAYLSIDNTGSTNDKFISYDDEHSCQVKVSFARNRQLGGVMIWELGEGYRINQPAGKKDPLLQAIKTSLATPRLTSVARTNQNIALTFTTLPLASYRVQWTSNLTSGVWNTLTSNVPGDGTVLKITDTNAIAQPQRYYRVKTPP